MLKAIFYEHHAIWIAYDCANIAAGTEKPAQLIIWPNFIKVKFYSKKYSFSTQTALVQNKSEIPTIFKINLITMEDLLQITMKQEKKYQNDKENLLLKEVKIRYSRLLYE